MSTLAEIEAAADSLPPQEQQELLLLLAMRLHAAGRALAAAARHSERAGQHLGCISDHRAAL